MTGTRNLIRIGMAVCLVALLLTRLNLHQLSLDWGRLNWTFAALGILITPVMVAVCVLRWSTLLDAQQMNSGFLRLFVLYLSGIFLNNLLPTSIGGDVLKAYHVGKDHRRMSLSAAAVFVDRLIGFVVLMLFAGVVFVLRLRHLHEPMLSLGFAVAFLGFGGLLLVLFLPRPVRWVQSVLLRGRFERLFALLDKWHQDVMSFRTKRFALLRCFRIAVAYHLLTIVHTFWVLRAFTGDGTLTDIFMLLPGIFLLSAVPLSVGGIGISEWAYLFFFGLAGVRPELAVSVSLFIRLKTVLFGGSALLAFFFVYSGSPVGRMRREVAAEMPGEGRVVGGKR